RRVLFRSAVVPALGGAVDDGGRRAVVERERGGLRGVHAAEVAAVAGLDEVPAVDVHELARVPLHVVAGMLALGGHAVGVDRGLIPVQVHDGVGEAGGGGGGDGLVRAAGREAAFALEDVHARALGAERVHGGERQSDGRR